MSVACRTRSLVPLVLPCVWASSCPGINIAPPPLSLPRVPASWLDVHLLEQLPCCGSSPISDMPPMARITMGQYSSEILVPTTLADSSTRHNLSPPQLIAIADEQNPQRTSPVPSSIAQHSDYINVARISAASWNKPPRQADYDVPHLVKTPWELERHTRKSIWSSRSSHEKEIPTYTLKSLPEEVYDCIISQLEDIHLGGDNACPPCYLRDLHSLTLTSRAWERTARPQL
jgi:hypothetical protein